MLKDFNEKTLYYQKVICYVRMTEAYLLGKCYVGVVLQFFQALEEIYYKIGVLNSSSTIRLLLINID